MKLENPTENSSSGSDEVLFSDAIIYENPFDALNHSGNTGRPVSKLGSPSWDEAQFKNSMWNSKNMFEYGRATESDGNGMEIDVPDGFDTIWIRTTGDTYQAIKAYSLEDSHQYGVFCTENGRIRNNIDPSGANPWNFWNKHFWQPIPVRSGDRVAVVAVSGGAIANWCCGLGFSKNNHNWTFQNAFHVANNGSETANHGGVYQNDVFYYLAENTNVHLKIPVIPDGEDKILYFEMINDDWNNGVHKEVVVNGTVIEKLRKNFINPIATLKNSKAFAYYLGAVVPSELITSNFLDVQINTQYISGAFSFREAGTHNKNF